MAVNFSTRRINRGAFKLARTPKLIKKKKKKLLVRILSDVGQLVKFYICFLEVNSLSLTNLRAIKCLHDR